MSKKIDLYDGGTGQRTMGRPNLHGHIKAPHPEKVSMETPYGGRGDTIGHESEHANIESGAEGFDAKQRPGKWNLHDGASRAGVLSNRDPATGTRAGAGMGTVDGMHRCNQGPMMNSGQRSNVVRSARIGHLSGGETHDRVPASPIDADVEPEYPPIASHKVSGSPGDQTP